MTAAARWACIPACGIAVLLLLACGAEQESQEPKPDWTTEKTPSPSIAGTLDADGNPLPGPIVSQSIPAEFPLDVPQYPGAEVKTSRVAHDGGMSVALSSGDELAEVVSYYEKTFAEQGWSTDVRPTPEGTAIFADKDSRTASALIRSGGQGTLVDVIVVTR